MKPFSPSSADYSKHIAENVAKGSSLCPLGAAVMKNSLAFGGMTPEAN